MNPQENNSRVLIVAAEASSALYAQRLLEFWRDEKSSIAAFGVGSQEMEDLGFKRFGKSEEMAVVGFQEVFEHYSAIKAVYNNILEEVKKNPPKYALLLDYPGFNLKLAKDLKELGIKVIYYISPQLWAWKKNRIKIVQKYVDRMLVLFPFEKPFYEGYNVPVDFVGHPLLDELHSNLFDEKERKLQRAKCGINENDLLLGLMPGSRKSELKHHLQTQIEVAENLQKKYPGLKICLMVAPGLDLQQVKNSLSQLDSKIILMQDEPHKMIRLADFILCSSGTATLQIGLLHVPMVIMYKMNILTAFLAKLVVRGTKYFGMINLILDEEVGPEFFQEKANVKTLSASIEKLINDKEHRVKVREKLSKTQELLGDKGATQRVAKILEEYL